MAEQRELIQINPQDNVAVALGDLWACMVL